MVELLDGEHAPDVQVESARLERPPAVDGNRFLRGWRGRELDGESVLMPLAEARVEVVTLENRARELVLRLVGPGVDGGASVRTGIPGRQPQELPVRDTLRIPLPADLPLGRSPVDLEFGDDHGLYVARAEVVPSHAVGAVGFEDGGLQQSGWSTVELVRRLTTPATLIGTFEPPAEPNRGQRFSIQQETERGLVTLFAWQGGGWRRSTPRSLRLPLEPDGGFVRLRFTTAVSGPAGSWRDLGLVLPPPPPVASAPPRPPPPRVVVLYVMDALRADHMGHLGHDHDVSPNLDRLAERSVVFRRHRSVAPNTLPSTKSLFTGQAFPRHGGSKLPPEGPETLAELFAKSGYRTALFSGNPNVSDSFGLTRGFDHSTEDWVVSEPASYHDSAERVHASALRWLDGQTEDHPIFAYVHVLNPHNPYDPPAALRQRFARADGSTVEGDTRTLLSIRNRRLATHPADHERLRDLYRASVAYADQQFQEFLAALQNRYDPSDVLLLVTSDHGEELFDHGGVLHGYTLYPEMLEIPLLVSWPTVLDPRVVDAPTDNLDVHETLRELLSLPSSGRGHGRSIWPLLQPMAAASGRDRLQFASAGSLKGGIFSVRSSNLSLVWAPRVGKGWGLGEGLGRSREAEYLFDLTVDPAETENLAGDRRTEAAWLRARLFAWIAASRDLESTTGSQAPELDPETEAKLKALGYL